MSDAVILAQEITPYVAAAVSAYGAAVLTQVEQHAADATVSCGQRLLRRLLRRTGPEQEAVAGAVNDLAGDPKDVDLQAGLRLAIRRALQADAQLASDIAAVPRPTVAMTASGERSVAAHTVHGNITTGDNHPPTTP
ncbi:hypothetical protein E6W39_03210 [Kitasatospora acidiphila]|uniref:Uncharacterized protein n=1 Tax=Kitasatospora acidiphila TaxID=2567942 RepID=A0A540VXD9_9ACTN|nr:hypothetical protein [Kitasatospora acidiphila]TQF01430.1 hypothetical protein E6W39_03210 [Kitasatospora acidiphila]